MILDQFPKKKNDNIIFRNTIIMNIEMLKKEVNLEWRKFRNNTFHKYNNKESDCSSNNKFDSNNQSREEIKDNFKNNRSKSIFKDKKDNNKNAKDKMFSPENSNETINKNLIKNKKRKSI